ncbi:hypothetical protein H5P28_15665 [Ruficoccus amylovorans]|uniref:Sodium/glucose cotransporter n=1 Tax=Ruficoccus amylovorans TaxID=1804625 RepID=A0A842HJA6_9BACT|nr:hypothetical protein [Ruficoccus amylovorans]MBC2595704.1 hypothetical protein [Ruficoccus amylovorans]
MNSSGLYIEIAVIAVYMLYLLGIGAAFKNFNHDISDFFRGGGRGTWWLVGASVFMANISAYTFTGASGVAFEAGWSVATIYIANSVGLFLAFLFFAAWFRQLRAITGPEVIEMRFGRTTQQLYAFLMVILGVVGSGLVLWAMAIFTAAVFGFPIWVIILVLGAVVMAYSTSGGSWAVMATDFVQSLIMVPTTIIVGVLALLAMGGFTGMGELVRNAGLESDFNLINGTGEFSGGQFTLTWALGIFMTQSILSNSMVSGPRFFSVKDGWEARKAAFLAFVLMAMGCVFWFLPPMAARLLFESDVLSAGASLNKPAEAAYAVASIKLLPLGMTGVIMVAMFSATMSSLDSGINRNAAIVIRDILPMLRKSMGLEPMEAERELVWSRWVSLALGLVVMGIALYYSLMGKAGMFEFMLALASMLGAPMSVPMLLGMFVKRVPAWSAVFAVFCGLMPSLLAFAFGLEWSFQQKVFINVGCGTAGFLSSMLFWKSASQAYRTKVEEFFTKMHLPVDFEKEVGKANDLSQLKILGNFVLGISSFFFLLLLVPNPLGGRVVILCLASSVALTGVLMRWVGARQARLSAAKEAAVSTIS